MTCNTCKANKVCDHNKYGFENCNNYIPDDVVEVVRCKDCMYYIPDAELNHEEYPNLIEADGLCDNCLRYTDATDFCSYGKRIPQKEG